MNAEFSSVAAGAIIVGVVFSIWPMLHQRQIESRAELLRDHAFGDVQFHVSKLAYFWPVCVSGIGFSILFSARNWPNGRLIMVTVGLVAILLGVVLAVTQSRSRIVIRSGVCHFIEGRKKCTFLLGDIKCIKFIAWYGLSIAVVLNDARRINIPMHFSSNETLLAILKFYRP